MLGKAQVKGIRPTWIGEQTWIGLLTYWDSKKFKQKSIQNKLNRSSTRGGALHSTGRKSHVDIALGLVSTLIMYISLYIIQFSTQYLILLTIFISFKSVNMVDLLSQMNYSWQHTLRRMLLG